MMDRQRFSQKDGTSQDGDRRRGIPEDSGLHDLHMSQHICHELSRKENAEDPQECYGDQKLRMCNGIQQTVNITFDRSPDPYDNIE